MSYIEILTGNGLTAEQWEDSIFKEYIGMLDGYVWEQKEQKR